MSTATVNNANIKQTIICELCCQIQVENVEIPVNSTSECDALSRLRSILANTSDGNINIMRYTLTNYSIHDTNGHLCSIDSGIMERENALYITGSIIAINIKNPGREEMIIGKEIGPILEWWLSSFDSDSQFIIGISTNEADYVLTDPHSNYKKYMTSITEKLHLSKLVIESILEYQKYNNPTYEDIMSCIINSINPVTRQKFTEEDCIAHAQFILDQIIDFDANTTNNFLLADTQCIETLFQLSGIIKPSPTFKSPQLKFRGFKNILTNIESSKITTTELVRDTFENISHTQLINKYTKSKLINSVFNDHSHNTEEKSLNRNNFTKNSNQWKTLILCKTKFVLIKNKNSTSPLIGRIEYLYKSNYKDKAHIVLFMHSYDTVLGETSNSQELFILKKCMNIDLNNVIRELDVSHRKPNDDWFLLGGTKVIEQSESNNQKNKNSFFYQFQYDEEFCRFEYPRLVGFNENIENKFCSNCEMNNLKKKFEIPELFEHIETKNHVSYFYKFKLKNEEYKVGSFIYLQPGIFSTASRVNFVDKTIVALDKSNKCKSSQVLKNVDETEYPEYYRKSFDNIMCGSNVNTPNPFEIAEILAIYIVHGDNKNIKFVVRRMYRAEQVLGEDAKHVDMNMLFCSNEQYRVLHKDMYGKCFVAYIANIGNPLTWTAGGPNRFYFRMSYDFISGTIYTEDELSTDTKLIGKEVCKDVVYDYVNENKLQYISIYQKVKELRCLDIFAGCGGLSRGLENSGLIKTKWAIECDKEAAITYKLNNPKTTVFNNDCNYLLKLAMVGITTNDKNQKIPQKGDVDFICGGPPCQGFDDDKCFDLNQYLSFKTSSIVSFLSYVDYYRPKFFVMENVSNFVSFKRSMVLKLTLRCITRMGYQCTFSILQAGNFGVPQTRRRLIIMAAAPGEMLSLFPEPIHVFNRKESLSVQVGDTTFRTNCKYTESAPLRTVTVYDAWSDLPEISNGASDEKIDYNSQPITHVQKLYRSPDNIYFDSILCDHICKGMSPLVQVRMELVPLCDGSDWRDLPNIEVKLPDGTITNKLLYTHHDLKNGDGPGGALRGVCSCANRQKCNPQDCQNNTIIPWCLSHTANKHNNWAGLYGRISWSGYCSITTTNPIPMGKQGRILHPEQHRVVSVRECARSQGFKDSFQFYGSIINKHRQIGNAVPPPIGTAIGHEIIKAIVLKNKS